LFGWAYFRTKKATAKEFSNLSSTLPDWIMLADDGLHFYGPNGAKSFRPWTGFSGWREGKRVILADSAGGAVLILPLSDKSEPEKEFVRQLLRIHFPSASLAAPPD
jgi:hypothetical protein